MVDNYNYNLYPSIIFTRLFLLFCPAEVADIPRFSISGYNEDLLSHNYNIMERLPFFIFSN